MFVCCICFHSKLRVCIKEFIGVCIRTMDKVTAILNFLSSSDSDDEDENFLLVRDKIAKINNFVPDVVHKWTDNQFQSNFRIERKTAYWLIENFGESTFYPKNLSHGGRKVISPEIHILSFIWFAANKTTLREVSQRFGIAVSALHRCLDRVMDFFTDMAPTVISMPMIEDEKNHVSTEFRKISGFPNILGCIDGTSINIRTPAHKIKSTYTNRHDIPSITLQAICDDKRRFIDVFTGAPGKIHDSRVLRLSDINTRLPIICGSKYHIIGDNAYPIRPYLLTPYKDYGNLTRQESNFNKKICSCRVRIENSFGILKGRFRQLLLLDMHCILKMSKFIIVCCVLHNLCIDFNDMTEINLECDDEEDAITILDNEIQLKKQGERKRNAIRDSLEYFL